MQKRERFVSAFKKNWVIVIGMISIFMIDTWIISKTKGMTTPCDEIGMFAVAAKLAGFDWSGVISDSGYYGFGYFVLFAPFFKYIKNPDVVHQIILAMSSLLKIAVIPIVYSIEIQFFNVKDRTFAGLVATALSIANVSLRAGRPYNEFPMHLVIWIDMFLLCKLIRNYEQPKKKMQYSMMFVLCLIYGLLLHKRMVTVIYAVIVTLMVLYLIKKKIYINCWAIIFGGVAWLTTNQIIEKVQNIVWGASGTELGNASVRVSNNISLTNMKMYLLWFNILLGNIATMIIQTGGLFVISIVACIFMVSTYIKKREISDKDLPRFGIVLCMILCMGATLLALLISNWYGGMTTTFFQGLQGNTEYTYKGMVYLRYWGLYVTPFIMCGVLWIYENNCWKYVISTAIGWGVCIISLFIKMVLPWIENNPDCLTFIQALAGWKKGDLCNRDSFLLCCMTFFAVFVALVWCVRKRKVKIALIMACVFFVWQQIWSSVYYDIPVTKEIYEVVDASVERLNDMEDELLPERIISLEFDKKRAASYKQSLSLQFYLKEWKIYTTIPQKLKKGDLIITRENIPEDIAKEIFENVTYEIEKIDKDEFWYIITGV